MHDHEQAAVFYALIQDAIDSIHFQRELDIERNAREPWGGIFAHPLEPIIFVQTIGHC